MYVGIVESKTLNYDGCTAFFRVETCNCASAFRAKKTTFPSEGKWLNEGTHIYIHVPEFINIVKEIFLNHDNAIYVHNEDGDDLSDKV